MSYSTLPQARERDMDQTSNTRRGSLDFPNKIPRILSPMVYGFTPFDTVLVSSLDGGRPFHCPYSTGRHPGSSTVFKSSMNTVLERLEARTCTVKVSLYCIHRSTTHQAPVLIGRTGRPKTAQRRRVVPYRHKPSSRTKLVAETCGAQDNEDRPDHFHPLPPRM